MNKTHYIFFGVLIAAVVFLQYDLNKRIEIVNLKKQTQSEPVAKVSPPAQAPTADEVVTVQVASEPRDLFTKKFKKEALELAKLQDDSSDVQERLKLLAKEMKPRDVQDLYEIISNDKNNGDTRALAVELLAIRNDTASLTALQNFVGNSKNVNGKKWDRKKEFESVLRAQAVESIAGFPERSIAISTLSFLKNRVDDKFLNDRISRATANLLTSGKSSQQQDEEALKKLVE